MAAEIPKYEQGWNAACCAIAGMLRDRATECEEKDSKHGKRQAVALRNMVRLVHLQRTDLTPERREKLTRVVVERDLQAAENLRRASGGETDHSAGTGKDRP